MKSTVFAKTLAGERLPRLKNCKKSDSWRMDGGRMVEDVAVGQVRSAGFVDCAEDLTLY